MSEFLGWIHHWLYKKIILSEQTEEELVQWAKAQGLPADEWRKQGINQYGSPTGSQPLEKIIDQANIHGWLQGKITATELRQAALITAILAEKPETKSGLVDLYKRQGERVAKEVEGSPDTPEKAYKALNDYLLEGMPCDRVTEFVANDDKEIVWRITQCLHKPYWDQVKGDVQHFYDLREAWVKAFVEGLSPVFSYVRTGITHTIVRK